MLTYFWGNIKAICILFVLLVSSCYNIVYAEDMGQGSRLLLSGAPGNNTTPATFSYNFGTVIVSDVNNNSPGTVLPSQDWKIGHYKAYCNSLMIMRFIFLVFLGLIRQERLVIIRGAIYLFL